MKFERGDWVKAIMESKRIRIVSVHRQDSMEVVEGSLTTMLATDEGFVDSRNVIEVRKGPEKVVHESHETELTYDHKEDEEALAKKWSRKWVSFYKGGRIAIAEVAMIQIVEDPHYSASLITSEGPVDEDEVLEAR